MAKKAMTLVLMAVLLAPGCATTDGGDAARRRQVRSWSSQVGNHEEARPAPKPSKETTAGDIALKVAVGTLYVSAAVVGGVLGGLLSAH